MNEDEQADEELYITVSCDIGAHERCRLALRKMRPCACWCHKKKQNTGKKKREDSDA
jgi:hypothetical protein